MDDNLRAQQKKMGSNGRIPKAGERVFDLVDVIQDDEVDEGQIVASPDAGDKIYDLVDVVEEDKESSIKISEFNDVMIKRISQIAEKVAREIVPGIAERVIREEIDKMKKDL
jgi:hypothetical protein